MNDEIEAAFSEQVDGLLDMILCDNVIDTHAEEVSQLTDLITDLMHDRQNIVVLLALTGALHAFLSAVPADQRGVTLATFCRLVLELDI